MSEREREWQSHSLVPHEIVLKPKKEMSIHNVKTNVLFVSYELMRKKQFKVERIIHQAQYGVCNPRDESNNRLALMIKGES